MSRYIFLISLDAAVTREEIFPVVLKHFSVNYQDISPETITAQGELPFQKSFLQKAQLLSKFPISEVNKAVENIELNLPLVSFLQKHRERCYIVTEYLNIWTDGLIDRLHMKQHTFCSKARAKDNRIEHIENILDKNAAAQQLAAPYVAIGNGNDDAEMIENAEIGIGYGGIKEIAPSVLNVATHAIYEEEKLIDFIERLL